MKKSFIVEYNSKTKRIKECVRIPIVESIDSDFEHVVSISRPLSEIFEYVGQMGMIYGTAWKHINDPTLNDIPIKPPSDVKGYMEDNLYDFEAMFFESAYNHPLDKWDVSPLLNTRFMFTKAEFHQDLGMWNIQPDCDCTGMFHLSKFTIEEVMNWKWVKNLNMPIEALFNDCEKDSYKTFFIYDSEDNS